MADIEFDDLTARRPGVLGGHDVGREVAALRSDVSGSIRAFMSPDIWETWTNPAAADPNGIVTSFASSASEDVRSGAELNGVVGAGVMSPPRNITITTTSHANIDAVEVVIVGTDINGDAATDTITLTDGGGATDVGAVCFRTVTSVTIPAQGGTNGALEVGFGSLIGLSHKIKVRHTVPVVLFEIANGSKVTNGVFASPTTSPPYGSYAPNTIPDASIDYEIKYEVDLS